LLASPGGPRENGAVITLPGETPVLKRLLRENAGPLVFAALLATHLGITTCWWRSLRPPLVPPTAQEREQHLRDLRCLHGCMVSERFRDTREHCLEAWERVREYERRHGDR
jgi:hypothetical protein